MKQSEFNKLVNGSVDEMNTRLFKEAQKMETKKNFTVARVWFAKANGQKMISVSKYCDIEPGDLVKVTKLEQ